MCKRPYFKSSKADHIECFLMEYLLRKLEAGISEFRVRTWVQGVSRQKPGLSLADLAGLPIKGKHLEPMSWIGTQKNLPLVS